MCFYRAFLADDSAAVFLQACSWFKNDKPIIVIAKLLTVLDLVACVLQLSGTVALSQSMYVFHVILPLILCFLTAYIILEAVRSQNSRAKRLMVPVFILALASCAEIINYHLKLWPHCHYCTRLELCFSL